MTKNITEVACILFLKLSLFLASIASFGKANLEGVQKCGLLYLLLVSLFDLSWFYFRVSRSKTDHESQTEITGVVAYLSLRPEKWHIRINNVDIEVHVYNMFVA